MRTLIAAALLVTIASSAYAQLPGEEYSGVTATALSLRKAATTKRVLVIGAHPDDEDNQLLSVLSLGEGADVAYLSLTRGEGGQNSIGSELGPELGVLRTGELLSARSIDRAQQFFARAYDFGFSKTAEESFQHWPRDSVLADVVSIVRRYRPDVIVAIFTGTTRDGHGQHQVSGILAREAFTAAADPKRFPEQLRAGLRPHRTLKLLQATGYRQSDPTQRFDTGQLDALFGRSYAQLAALSRSRHRSQDMGRAQTLGAGATSVRLLQSLVPVADSTMFSGLDTTLSAIAHDAGENAGVVSSLQRFDSLIVAAQAQLSPYNTQQSSAVVAKALSQIAAAVPGIRNDDVRFRAENEVRQTSRALLQSAGIVIDALADAESIVPGSTVRLDLTVWNAGRQPVRIAQLEPLLPAGWRFERTDSSAAALAPGALATRRFRVSVPVDAVISQPYFLAQPRPGDYYAWPSGSDLAGLPFQESPVQGSAVIEIAGVPVRQTVMATRRVVDPRQGELRRAVHVTPGFVLRPETGTAVITLATLASGSGKSIDAGVEIASNGARGDVIVKPQLPPGWRATPEQTVLTLTGAGAANSVHFAITPPRNAAAGKYDVRFIATDANGRTYDLDQRVVDYPHISNQPVYEPALMHVTVLDAQFARGMRVGYVVGVDAQVPQVLAQLGMSVELLDAPALANADLGKYDAIVVGSRAYEVRPDLLAHNTRILDYGRKGGNVVVLYQQYEFIAGNFAPFALTIARPHDRITDENAPVRLLDPADSVLARPNRIANADFEGWVQERSLYMPHTWAPQYRPLLEMNDPGEPPQQGAIVTAPLGAGHYTYTGISFFREIPAGVPGALRLFVNLLSQGVKDVTF